MAKEKELAYWAGFVDGEGWIGITKAQFPTRKGRNPQYQMRIEIHNTNKEIIEQALETFGGFMRERVHGGNQRDSYAWALTSNKAKFVLVELLPYLRIKKKQAELAIKLQETLRANKSPVRLSAEEVQEREDLYIRMKVLNKRGK